VLVTNLSWSAFIGFSVANLIERFLVVGPNSGYGTDNRCLLDALANGHGPFLSRLRELGMWAQVQTQGDQFAELKPLLLDSGAPLLFDHAGRFVPSAGLSKCGTPHGACSALAPKAQRDSSLTWMDLAWALMSSIASGVILAICL
jgi:hypothetical protein